MADGERDLATAELLGALAYGQLRAHAAAAAVAPLAPTVRQADRMLAFAAREQQRHALLRDRLDELTDLSTAVIERQRGPFDRYFEALPLDVWPGAVVFLAVGRPIAADFVQAVAPTVDEATGQAMLDALADDDPMAQDAHDELRRLLADDEEGQRTRTLVTEVVSQAVTAFTEALGRTDALERLFAAHAAAQGDDADGLVRRTAVEVLEAHRRRMVELGLDDLR